MQHTLSSQFETVWKVADLVSRSGCHDFHAAQGEMRRVVSFCGLKVYFDEATPVRLFATDLDLTLDRLPEEQSFEAALAGTNFRFLHALANDQYLLNFKRGDYAALVGWLDRLQAFGEATAIRRAA